MLICGCEFYGNPTRKCEVVFGGTSDETFDVHVKAEFVSVGCMCNVVSGGGSERLSTPQVQRLLLHVLWLHRRKRDCTPALFLTSSVCTSTLSPCSSEEEGWHLSLPPHNVEEFYGGGGTGPPPHTAGLYLGGRRTGLLPHNNGGYLGGGDGTLRRYHPSGQNGAAAQMGRSGDTMVCGLACVLHTGAGQCRSGRSAIPCGGCAGCS